MKIKKIIVAVLIFAVFFAVVYTSYEVGQRKTFGQLIEQGGEVKEIIFVVDVTDYFSGANIYRFNAYKLNQQSINFKNCVNVISDYEYDHSEQYSGAMCSPDHFVIILFVDNSYIIISNLMVITKWSAEGNALYCEYILVHWYSHENEFEMFKQLFAIKILGELTTYEFNSRSFSSIWAED